MAEQKLDVNGQRNEVALAILHSYTFKTIQKTGEILYYNDEEGIYKPEAEEGIIRQLVRTHLGKDATIRAESEVKHYIQADTPAKTEDFDNNSDLLHFANCWYNVNTGETFSHNEERLSRSKLAVKYDPNARCPRILRFFGQVLAPRDIFHIIQQFGYALYGRNQYEKVFYWLGSGGNGKGVCADLLTAFLGPDNMCGLPTKSLTNDPYAIAQLERKMVNIDHDSEEQIELVETSMLKKLISGNMISARNLYEPYHTFKPRVKLFILTNSPPQIQTLSKYADMRRMDLVTFNRTMNAEEIDVNLIQKLTTAEELSGLLNLALVGLKYLLSEGWARAMTIQAMQREYDNFGDTIGSFVAEHCIIDSQAQTPTVELYQKYLEYSKLHGKKQENNTTFGGELAKMGIENRARRVKGILTRHYIGIKPRILSEVATGKQNQLQ
jgi:putative DNA primase/helicase